MAQWTTGGVRGTANPARMQLMVDVARRFYIEDESRVEIANSLGLSRFKVARLLQAAKDSGVVRISIAPPTEIDVYAASALSEKWGVPRVFVVPTVDDEDWMRSRLAETAASYLVETITPSDVLGLSAGRTTSIMAGAIAEMSACTVIQTTGAGGTSINTSPIETVRRVAEATGSQVYPLYAPMVLESARSADDLRRLPDVASTIEMFPRLTKLVSNIGSWRPGQSAIYDTCSQEDREAITRAGVVAEILGVLLTADGKIVMPEFTRRCITVPADIMRTIPDMVVVTSSHPREQTTRAALRAQLVGTLITDSATAELLLEDAVDR